MKQHFRLRYRIDILPATLLIGCLYTCACSDGQKGPSESSAPVSDSTPRPVERATPNTAAGPDTVEKLVEQIDKGGVASVPGLGPGPDHPGTVYYVESKSREKHTVTSKSFSVGQNWRLHYLAGPTDPAGKFSYFVVELLDAPKNGKPGPGSVIIDKQFSTLPIFAGETESDASIFPKGGTFVLRITANVPYALEVRQ
jgi:hypothetical protein